MNDYCELPTAQRIAKAREKLGLEPMETVRVWTWNGHDWIAAKAALLSEVPAPSTGESFSALGLDRPFGSHHIEHILTATIPPMDPKHARAFKIGSSDHKRLEMLYRLMVDGFTAEAVGLLLAVVYEAQVKGAR